MVAVLAVTARNGGILPTVHPGFARTFEVGVDKLSDEL